MDADFVKLVHGRTSEKQEGQDCEVLPLSVKSVDPEKRQVTGIASSETIDRDGEIVTIAALRKAIKGYMKNAVVLAGHAHRLADGHSPTVGRVVAYKFIGKALQITVEFAKTELGEEYWILYRDKFQRGFSISFRSLERPQEEIIEGKRIPVYTEIELYEISCVPVPANPEALTKAKQRKQDFVNRKRGERAGAPFDDDRAEEFAKAFFSDIYDCEGYAAEVKEAEEEIPREETIWNVWQEKENELCRQFGNRELYRRYKKYRRAKELGGGSLREFSNEEKTLFKDVEGRGAEAAIHKMKTGFYGEDDETEQLKGLVTGRHHS